MKDDKDVTEADFTKYNVVLFGDPGSNSWIGKMNGKLPVSWTKETVAFDAKSFPAAESLPAFIYPNPMAASKYVVVNSGLTAEWHAWASDHPRAAARRFRRAKGKGRRAARRARWFI